MATKPLDASTPLSAGSARGKDRTGGKTLQVGDFLDDFEKDDVKQKTDIVVLFESFGVKLEKKGSSWMGNCPFHDDKTPSLSVDREKGVFHCFGCGESGDAFTLVQKTKGVGFREALEYLRGGTPAAKAGGNGKGAPHVSTPQPDVDPAPKLETAEPKWTESPTSISLLEVSVYWHRRLIETKETRAYLARRGLGDAEFAQRFYLGYCDGTLPDRCSEKQKAALAELGVLHRSADGSYREHFAGCLVVPLCGKDDRAVGFYGRAIDDARTPRHLYLKGPHRGLVNGRAAKAYPEELILAESVIDAMSLVAADVVNAVPCYGTGGFTDEHLALMKASMTKTVILAFDSDEAGTKGAAALKDRLIAEGFTVKVIAPERKDWNEDLVAGVLSKDAVRAKIEAAPRFAPATAGEPDFGARRDGPKWVFTLGKLAYRVLGVPETFFSSLKVNVRLTAADVETKYFDNVDLYSSRSRILFADNASRLLGVEPGRIERDLVRIVEHLEAVRDKALAGIDAAVHVVTDEERRLGMELLADPDLFRRIVDDTEKLGYVGEDLNKLLVYLAASSRKLDDPVSVIVVSQSASGKSLLIDTVKKLMPEEDVVAVTSLSDQALNYLPEEGLMHKFLVLGEAVHSDSVEHQLREMLSGKELSRLVVMKDEKTGELSTRKVRKDVVVSAVMSSTNYDMNAENASRCFVVNTDESAEQTARIHRKQRRKYSLESLKEKSEEVPAIVARHRAAQRILEKRVIVNPFAQLLDFPSALMRTRRDHERFLDLIACACFLRQFQKEPKTADGTGYIECDLEDYAAAQRIMTGVMESTFLSFPESASRIFDEMRKLAKTKAAAEGLKTTEVGMTQRELRETTGLNQMFVKRNLRILLDYEYIVESGSKRRGSRRAYSLTVDEDLRLVDLSAIPSPEAIALKLQNIESGSSGSNRVKSGSDPLFGV